MADSKISQLPSGGALQDADELLIARGGANFKVAGSAIPSGILEFTLSGATSVGATTVTIQQIPLSGFASRVTFIAIDPFTTECEIRSVTGISGSVLTLDRALNYAHANSDKVLVLTSSFVLTSWFGCKGDNSTDDHASLQAAIIECQAANLILNGQNKLHAVSQPLFGRQLYLTRISINAKSGYSPADTNNAMFMIPQDAPQSFTATASDDTFTTPAAHLLGGVGNLVAFQGASLPSPLVAGRIYFVKTIPTTTTFTVSATSGGATLDITADGSGTVQLDVNALGRAFFYDVTFSGSSIAGVNGINAVVQQPAEFWKVRVDNCPGYGFKIQGQDGAFYGLQATACGSGLVLGGTPGAGEINETCSIMKFYALDIENSTTQAVLFNNSSDILIDGFHGETNPINFSVPTNGSMTNATFMQAHISYATGNIGWKINAGATANSAFQIIAHRAYGSAAGQKIIEDLDRGRNLIQEDLDQLLVLGSFVQPGGNVVSHTLDKVPQFVTKRTTGTLSFGSIAANTTAVLTETVTGATTAMAVFVSPEGNLGTGFVWSARVNAVDTVTFIIANVTTGALTPASFNWRIVCATAS